MLGGMLAGHDEGGGDIVTKHISTGGAYKTDASTFIPILKNKIYSILWNGSDAAFVKHFGGLKDYRASEGREVLKISRGKVDTIQTILGGVRSACTYAGAKVETFLCYIY